MGRKRQYADAAERLRAFRARVCQEHEAAPVLVSPLAEPKRKASRAARLLTLETDAQALLDEFETWRENLPESLQESRVAAKLDDAIDKLTDIVEAAASIDPPKGYGRD